MNNNTTKIPISVLTDSYKAGHFAMYPKANRMVAYGECRTSFNKDPNDSRLVVYGIRYFVETYLMRQWTMEDIEEADKFYSTHNIGPNGSFAPYPYPRDLFIKFIQENNGYFPIKLQALRDGSCVHTHVPIYQITAEDEYSRLCTFFETLLTHVWYACNVATLSRRTRDLIEAAFQKSVDEDMHFLVESRLHDFGFRGVTGLEASVVGGTAHLLNFRGSDTMSAAYYAQFHLNNGKPVAQSIPATEHSVMTSWPTEQDAIENMIDQFGHGFFACVLDSYDYQNCLDNILPQVKEKKQSKGGFMTLRPDSGDPVEAVLMGLKAAEKTFGATTNKKGYKVINGAAVIQGDGINYNTIAKILDAVMEAGYSVASVLFGMGGGLLQRHNRDTMAFATKLSHIEYADGTKRDVMKMPKTDTEKISMPGILEVKKTETVPTIFPVGDGPEEKPDLLETVYDCGPVEGFIWEDFDTVRNRVREEWTGLPKQFDPISDSLKEKIAKWIESQKALLHAVKSKN